MKGGKKMLMSKHPAQSLISPNRESNRIYLMDLSPDDFPQIIGHMKLLAEKEGYTKIFAKVPARFAPSFVREGYIAEAYIPGFYNGTEDAFFLMLYTDQQRQQPEQEALAAFQELLNKPVNANIQPLNANYALKKLGPQDAPVMTDVFRRVFESYPFPIFEEEFLIKSMQEDGTVYFGAWHNDSLVAISSAECCSKNKNAEMTDFAVLPEHRGQRLAVHLLGYMEQTLISEGFKTFYTIARLHSLSMNKTFYNLGYKYCGTLHNNTQISGKIESMNVWYKNV